MIKYKINCVVYLIIAFILCTLTSIHIIWKYANRKVFKWYTYITVTLQYICAFSIIAIIPLDLALTIYGRQSFADKQYYYECYEIIFNAYLSFYWGTIILSNFVLIFEEQYNSNGFFTTGTKIRNVCKQLSSKIIGTCLCSVIFFGILVGSKTVGPNLKAVLLTSILITNTVWMVFLMLLLGYGLIMFPVDIWKRGNYDSRLKKIQREIAQEFSNITHSYSDIFLCISNIQKTKKEIESFYKQDQNLNNAIDVLLNESPLDIDCQNVGNVIINKQKDDVTIGALANYREKLYWANAIFTTSQGKLNKLQSKAYFLEDLIDATSVTADIDSKINNYKSIKWSFKPRSTYYEYIWFVFIKPLFYKIISIICTVMSICSYIGIASSIKNVPLIASPYFLIIHSPDISQTYISTFVFLTIGYTWYVAKWSLFEMKTFKSLELVGNRVTWPIPMSTNSRMFASLSSPLVFFYLGWMHENGIIEGSFENDFEGHKLHTIFSQFYTIKTIPIAGNPFNAFFPLLIISVSLLTIANQLNNLLVSLHCSGFQFDQYDIDNTAIENGKLKLSKRKKLIKQAYLNMLEQHGLTRHLKQTKQSNGIVRTFFKGFTQQSKFHSDVIFLECDEENQHRNDNGFDSSLNSSNSLNSAVLPNQSSAIQEGLDIISLGKKVGSFSDIFKKYGVRPINK